MINCICCVFLSEFCIIFVNISNKCMVQSLQMLARLIYSRVKYQAILFDISLAQAQVAMSAQLLNNLLRCSHTTMAFLFDNGIYGLLCSPVILSQHLKTFRVDKMTSTLL